MLSGALGPCAAFASGFAGRKARTTMIAIPSDRSDMKHSKAMINKLIDMLFILLAKDAVAGWILESLEQRPLRHQNVFGLKSLGLVRSG